MPTDAANGDSSESGDSNGDDAGTPPNGESMDSEPLDPDAGDHGSGKSDEGDDGRAPADGSDRHGRVNVDRRTVLGGAALSLGSGAVGYLLGSGTNPTDLLDSENDASDEHLPFDVWGDAQNTLRTTPSHLPGRAAQLVDRARRRDEIAEQRADEEASDGITVRSPDDTGNETGNTSSFSVGTTGGRTGTLSSGPGATGLLSYTLDDTEADGFDEFEPGNITEEVLEELFEFVKEAIHVVPTDRDDIGNVDEVVRWGGRGALRCGMGTPRDKAEALAYLYRQAGFTATVRMTDVDIGDVGLTSEDVKAELLTPRDWMSQGPDFGDQIDEWAEQLGREVPDEGEASIVDEDGKESMALAESLRDLLPAEPSDSRRGPDDFDWRWNSSGSSTQPVPIVEVFDDDHERYHANLFGDVAFGETGADEPVETAPEPDVQTVSVTLSAAMPDTLGDPFELVSGEWEVPDLIGRQLLVRTGSMIDPIELPMVGIEDMNMFLPSLAVQDPHLNPEAQADLSEFGDMITLHGDKYSLDFEIEDGEVVMENEAITKNGEEFYDPKTAPDPSEIDSLEVSADPADHPRITLEATALDEDGEHVTGLTGSVFAATDEGTAVAPTMVANRPEAEIIYLIDESGSMDTSDDAAIFEEIREVMEQEAPGANIEVKYVDSAMWTHFPNAVADSPDLIVYAHDGRPTDDYDERVDKILADSPPALLLSDGESETVESEVVLEQAELSGGDVAPLNDRETVLQAVRDAVGSLDIPTYRFNYEVPDQELGTREVELFVGDKPVEESHEQATTAYEAEERGMTRTLVGLYLTVEHEGHEVTRTLGGWDPLQDEEWSPGDEPDPETGFGMPGLREFARDTKMALLGGIDISFEGDGSLAPVIFDDLLESRQSYRELDAVVSEHDIDEETEPGSEAHQALLKVMEGGTTHVQWAPSAVQAPLPNRVNEDGLTYFLGPRMVLSQTKATIDSDDVTKEHRLDIPPMTRATTATDDPDDRFFRTLERTARMAIMEDAVYDSSTLSLIGDSGLTDVDSLPEHDVDPDPYDDMRRYVGLSHRDHQLVPIDGSEVTLWNVDNSTGTLIGLMPDGTGGALRRRTVSTLASEHQLGKALSIFNALMDEIDCCSVSGGGAMGAVALYFQLLAALYARVAAVIGAMEVDATVGGLVAGAAYDVAKDEATDHWIFDFWEMAEATGM